MERLVRSRTIAALDDVAVWSIVCFKVRVGYRRQGVARALLDGAIDYARDRTAPRRSRPTRSTPTVNAWMSSFSYVGFTAMFEAAGFERLVETAAHSAGRPRILMRRSLDGAA